MPAAHLISFALTHVIPVHQFLLTAIAIAWIEKNMHSMISRHTLRNILSLRLNSIQPEHFLIFLFLICTWTTCMHISLLRKPDTFVLKFRYVLSGVATNNHMWGSKNRNLHISLPHCTRFSHKKTRLNSQDQNPGQSVATPWLVINNQNIHVASLPSENHPIISLRFMLRLL